MFDFCVLMLCEVRWRLLGLPVSVAVIPLVISPRGNKNLDETKQLDRRETEGEGGGSTFALPQR